jgi:hypothetical protein
MSLISGAEIDAMRADLARMLPDICTISRAQDTSDGGGGQTTTWPPVATGVPCRLTPASAAGAGRRDIADRLTDDTTHIVTFAAGLDVRQGDHVTIDGQAFLALVVGTGGAWELARHVEVRPVA